MIKVVENFFQTLSFVSSHPWSHVEKTVWTLNFLLVFCMCGMHITVVLFRFAFNTCVSLLTFATFDDFFNKTCSFLAYLQFMMPLVTKIKLLEFKYLFTCLILLWTNRTFKSLFGVMNERVLNVGIFLIYYILETSTFFSLC